MATRIRRVLKRTEFEYIRKQTAAPAGAVVCCGFAGPLHGEWGEGSFASQCHLQTGGARWP
jgi:hypothetical protein